MAHHLKSGHETDTEPPSHRVQMRLEELWINSIWNSQAVETVTSHAGRLRCVVASRIVQPNICVLSCIASIS